MSAGFFWVFSPPFVVIGGHIIDKSCQSIRIFAVKVEVDGEVIDVIEVLADKQVQGRGD